MYHFRKWEAGWEHKFRVEREGGNTKQQRLAREFADFPYNSQLARFSSFSDFTCALMSISSYQPLSLDERRRAAYYTRIRLFSILIFLIDCSLGNARAGGEIFCRAHAMTTRLMKISTLGLLIDLVDAKVWLLNLNFTESSRAREWFHSSPSYRSSFDWETARSADTSMDR